MRPTQYAGLIARAPKGSRRYKGAVDAVTGLVTGPKVPKINAPPLPDDTAAIKAREEERRAARARSGLGQTILTSGLGVQGQPKTQRATLLGQSGQGG